MKKIKISTFKLSEELIIEIKDLISNNHPEFENYNDIEFHINEAIRRNGLRYFGKSVFTTVYKKELPSKSISFSHHLYHLLGGAKGIIKHRIKYSKSTFLRYEKHLYETIDLLTKKTY